MSLQLEGYIPVPAHVKAGGFDHAAIHQASARLYIAHTVNDGLDVVDCATNRYLNTMPNLSGVAGVLVSGEQGLVFTSNRARKPSASSHPKMKQRWSESRLVLV